MGGHFILDILWICCLISVCTGQCTFPSNLTGSWISSEIGANELEFTASTFSGYTVDTFGTFNFSCELQSDTKYVVKSENFKRFNLNFNVYMCLDITQVNDTTTGQLRNLFTYYKASEQLKAAGYERVKLWLSTRTLSSYTEICTVTDYTDIPYSVLLQNGTIANETINCPIPFLGVFGYTYDTGSGNLCTNSSYVDVCSDKTTMTWNYTQCSQIQAYSTGGVTNCVYYTEEGNGTDSVYTLHVYNQDASVDQSTNYRFTCYKVSGYETVYATQSPGNCLGGQNETSIASPGGTLVLNASVVCAYDIPVDSSSPVEVLSAGAIAGICIAVFIIIAIIVVLISCWYYRKRQREKQAEWEAANRKVDPEELSPNMRLGLPNESKYDLDRLMYSPVDEKGSKARNGFVKGKRKGKGKGSRKDLLAGFDRMESYNEGEYMDESQRQTALESGMFTEKRKRKDGKDEFKANDPKNKQYSDRVKDMARGKRRPNKIAALAKLRLRPKAKPMPGGDSAEKGDKQSSDVVIQVEEAEVENKRKTRFADEQPAPELKSKGSDLKKGKALEDIDTLSDIIDNEMGVNDLSDEEKEPRLILPNLNPQKKEKKKRRRRRLHGSEKVKPRKPITKSLYVNWLQAPYIRKVVLFKPNSSRRRRMPWNLPPVVKPRPWSKMVRRFQKARSNQVTPRLSPTPSPRRTDDSEDPDETPHHVASHLGLRSLTTSHLWDAWLNWRLKEKYSQESGNRRTSAMPLNTRFMPPKGKLYSEESFIEPPPIIRNAPNLASMPPLQRIHRKESSNLWKDILGNKGENGKIDLETLKKTLPENRWRKLLEELYRDKKYFDYVKKTSSTNELDLGSAADDGLQFLYGRALFWEEQQPIPARPPSSVRRMYSRHQERSKSSAGLKRSSSLKRSATMLPRSKSSGYGFKSLPRTPSTQVSRLRRREATGGKTAKDDANNKLKNNNGLFPNGGPPPVYFEGGTQTEFSPSVSPLLLTDSMLDLGPTEQYERMSLPGSVIPEEERQSLVSPVPSGQFVHPPPAPIQKDLTKSDIKLEDMDNTDKDYNHEMFRDEEVTIAI